MEEEKIDVIWFTIHCVECTAFLLKTYLLIVSGSLNWLIFIYFGEQAFDENEFQLTGEYWSSHCSFTAFMACHHVIILNRELYIWWILPHNAQSVQSTHSDKKNEYRIYIISFRCKWWYSWFDGPSVKTTQDNTQ